MNRVTDFIEEYANPALVGTEKRLRHKLFGRHRWSDWSVPKERPRNYLLGGYHQFRSCTACGYAESRIIS